MVFCNWELEQLIRELEDSHNPYFNRWFSAIKNKLGMLVHQRKVTILILIDGFLQYGTLKEFNLKNDESQSLF